MFKVYIIYSPKRGKYYTGQSQNLDKRIIRHNSGQVTWTQNGIPWDLIFQKDLTTRREAIIFERKIKKRGAKRFLQDNDLL